MTEAGKLTGWLAGCSDLWQQTHKSLFLSASVFGNKARQLVSRSLFHIGSCFAKGDSARLFLFTVSSDMRGVTVVIELFWSSLC